MSQDSGSIAKTDVNRRDFFMFGAVGSAAALALSSSARGETQASAPAAAAQGAAFELDETTIQALQAGMTSGQWTAESIAEKYLARIEALDKQGPAVNSVIELNPEAMAIAAQLDQERKAKGPRGPMHGIPVLIKDNLDTADKMSTTAGSLALVGPPPLTDSFVARQLRAAGAVILGKTNLSEWANIRSNKSTSGWSARGGQTRNPYVLDRNPCGSSSGTGAAIAANFATVGIGTETDGSIVCPSTSSCLVGIKPTVGLVSRSGIIPISHSQDTAGPMARTVTDAAILLSAIAGVDSKDPVTEESRGKSAADYTKFLDPNGLKGARIGVARHYFGFSDAVDKLMQAAVDVLKAQGAVIVDPSDIPTAGKFDDTELVVLLYELKADLNFYLASRGPAIQVHTLKDVIDFNEKNRDKEMPYFGQELFIQAQAKGPLTTKEYVKALEKNHKLTREQGIDAILKKNKLDALIAPTGGPCWPTDPINGDHFTGGYSSASAIAGYPHITVPNGFVYGLPVGISFFAGAYSEPTLIKFAYAYEQATKLRRPPRFLERVELGG